MAMINTNSGSETERAGSAELKGSNDTVTKCRFATANTKKINANGMTIKAVRNFRISCPLSEVRAPLPHALSRTSESHGHEQTYNSSAAFDLKFLNEICGTHCRNFKSAALVLARV